MSSPTRICVRRLLCISRKYPSISMSVFPSGSLDVINCTFEQQGACSWHQSETDDTDWIWSTGSTSTAGTGPSNDHTIGSTRMP